MQTTQTAEERAKVAVDAIVDDLTDRRGLRHEWDNLDEAIQIEIMDAWKQAILDAMTGAALPAPPAQGGDDEE